MGELWNKLENRMKIIIFILGFITTISATMFGVMRYAGSQLDSKIMNIVEKKIKDTSLSYNNKIVEKLNLIDKKIDTRFESIEEKLDKQQENIDVLTDYFEQDKIKSMEMLVWKIQNDKEVDIDTIEMEKCIEDYDKIKNKDAKTIANYEIIVDRYKESIKNNRK
jgi:hypothetical protein